MHDAGETNRLVDPAARFAARCRADRDRAPVRDGLAARVGSGIGGFLNATFGNAAELIIGLVALSKGLTGVVKASIAGSIIGNLLLVLGASILAGGLRH